MNDKLNDFQAHKGSILIKINLTPKDEIKHSSEIDLQTVKKFH